MVFKSIIGTTCACLAVVSFNADTALVSRLGGLAYYDTDADLTWLTDAGAGGFLGWEEAKAWTAGLDIDGVTGWRLPEIIDVGDGSYDTVESELSNMYYNVLGCDAADACLPGDYNILTNTGPFTGLEGVSYYLATPFAGDPNGFWLFSMETGMHAYDNESLYYQNWAVRDGDVVPIPSAIWLFGSGLLGLVGVARRKKA